MKIELDKISAQFIFNAIQYQKESGIVFEHDTSNKEFKECYGFTRAQLKKSLDNLRAQLPSKKTLRERMSDGEFDKGEIQEVSIVELKNLIGENH